MFAAARLTRVMESAACAIRGDCHLLVKDRYPVPRLPRWIATSDASQA
jgi:hypothetical protein